MSAPNVTANNRGGLPVFVINLDHRRDRWRYQRLQSRAFGIRVERIAAQDGRAGRSRWPSSPLTDGALGLWSTFIDLVQDLNDMGIEAAVILEDDAVLKPGFLRHVEALRRACGDTVAVVQVGSLGSSAWRPKNSLTKNIRKTLRPKSRLRAWVRGRSRPRASTPLLTTELRFGTHALLVFPRRLDALLSGIQVAEEPLDVALRQAALDLPGAVLRATRNGAFQLPVASDIPFVHP